MHPCGLKSWACYFEVYLGRVVNLFSPFFFQYSKQPIGMHGLRMNGNGKGGKGRGQGEAHMKLDNEMISAQRFSFSSRGIA